MPTNKTWFEMKAADSVGEIKIHNEIGFFGINAEDFGRALDSLGNVSELKININSPGGEVFDGFAIYNMLRRHNAKKTVVIDGVAASIASVIAMAGDRVVMPANSFLMIHNPMLFMGGGAEDLRKAAELLDKIKKNAMGVYKRRAKDLDESDIAKMMDDETWMNAEEAVLNGFADLVEDAISEPVEDDEKMENHFSRVPTACMCYFKPKNSGEPAADPAVDGEPVEPEPINEPEPPAPTEPEPIVEPNQPTQSGAKTMPMSTKEIVAKTLAGQNKISGEITNLCAMATEKLGAELAAQMKTEISANTDLSCDEPEQIETKAAEIVANLRVKAAEFLLKNLQAVAPKSPDVRVGADETQKFYNAAGVILSSRAHLPVDAKELDSVRANGFGDMGLQGFCREVLQRAGVRNAASMPAAQVYDSLVENRPRMTAAQGSGDFANVLADVANKVLIQGWNSANTTYQAWTGTDSIPDFRPKYITKISETGDVLEVKEGEGIPITSMKDSKETAQLITVGVGFGLTRKAIVNDDLGALTDIPAKLGRSVPRYINRAVYELLYGTAMAGPTLLEDNAALLSSTHLNFVASGSGGAPSVATLATLRQKMMKQRLMQPDGGQSEIQYTNVPPAFILYHSNHDIVVHQLITSTYDITSAGSLASNIPFIKGLIPIWDPVLDELMDATAGGHTGWYLLASPRDIATVTVFGLSGKSAPTMRMKNSDVGDPLGIAWDLYYDCGVAATEFRGVAGNYGK